MTLLKLITNIINFVTQDDVEKNELLIKQVKESANYKSFVLNALPEINRAIQEMTPYKKFPTKDIEITDYNYQNKGNNVIIDISEISEEIYEIFKVEYVDSHYDTYPLNYRKYSNDKLLVENPCFKGIIHIVYYPKIRILTEVDYGENYNDECKILTDDKSTDLKTLGITEQMCHAIIPHIVKARIWQEIEPNIAQTELGIGFQNLANLSDGAGTDYVQYEICLEHDYR